MSEVVDFDGFSGNISVWLNKALGHLPAKRYAEAACAPAFEIRSLLFRNTYVAFTDGSAGRRADDPSGRRRWCSGAAAWRLHVRQPWKTRGWPLPSINKIHHAEMKALELKLRVALQQVDILLANPAAAAESDIQLQQQELPRFLCFSDSEGCLHILRKLRRGGRLPQSYPLRLLRRICLLSHCLKARGVLVDLRWVPSHCGVLGNELADAAAKASRPDVLDPVKYPPQVCRAAKKKNRGRMDLVLRGG